MGLWKVLRKWGHLVSKTFSFAVGDGKRIKFWKDRWCGDSSLNIVFPSLFTLASVKEAWMGDSVKEACVCWNPTFIKPFND